MCFSFRAVYQCVQNKTLLTSKEQDKQEKTEKGPEKEKRKKKQKAPLTFRHRGALWPDEQRYTIRLGDRGRDSRKRHSWALHAKKAFVLRTSVRRWWWWCGRECTTRGLSVRCPAFSKRGMYDPPVLETLQRGPRQWLCKRRLQTARFSWDPGLCAPSCLSGHHVRSKWWHRRGTDIRSVTMESFLRLLVSAGDCEAAGRNNIRSLCSYPDVCIWVSIFRLRAGRDLRMTRQQLQEEERRTLSFLTTSSSFLTTSLRDAFGRTLNKKC